MHLGTIWSGKKLGVFKNYALGQRGHSLGESEQVVHDHVAGVRGPLPKSNIHVLHRQEGLRKNTEEHQHLQNAFRSEISVGSKHSLVLLSSENFKHALAKIRSSTSGSDPVPVALFTFTALQQQFSVVVR